MRRIVLRALALAVLALLACLPAAARDWHLASFHTNISVDERGVLYVNERIQAVFIGQFNGIYRTIPVEYPGPRNTNYSLQLKVISVTGENGQPLKYERRTRRGTLELKIFVPGAVDTSRTVNISYVVQNGVRFFETHDELYWNVTGNDWPVPIESASATVAFPPRAAGQMRAQAFTGSYGATNQDSSATISGSNVSFESANPLSMREGLTIDVYLPKGILDEPSALQRALWFLRGNPILLLPFFSLLVMYTVWRYKGRDPDPGVSVAPMYEPPKDMPAAEVGALADDRVDPRDITAILIGLAVKGFVKIEEVVEEGWLFDSKDYDLRLLKNEPWEGLADYEAIMLRDVFLGGSVTRLSALKNRFYTSIPKLKSSILAALKQKGMYSLDPDSANIWRILAIVLIAAPFLLFEWLGWASFFTSAWLAAVAIGAALFIVWIIGRHMTAKSFRGVRTWVAIRGFQEFMQRVDADRLRRMPPDTFEKYLPFAMALGVEERWAKAFEGIVASPPQWYHSQSGRMFNPHVFTNDMRGFTHTAAAAFVSAPRASSSGSGFSGGGFSGGGFSGGGFGGGGGGAF